MPDMAGTLIGDKAGSAVFDTTKIKRFVPEFGAVTPYAKESNEPSPGSTPIPPGRRSTPKWTPLDRLIDVYERGLASP